MTPGTSDFFRRQVEANTEALVWAVGEVGETRLRVAPPVLLGEWPAARHLFHLLYYEREVALPSLRLWFGAPYPDFEGYDEPAAWAGAPQAGAILAQIEGLRAEQLDIIARADDALWAEVRQTPWAERTLYWVASKTLQHALEHTNNLLKIALLWEHYETRSRRKALQAPKEGGNEIE
ncbi:MAG TPA: DinB family protein [Chloroflexia bacterium]|nr:DinB family protein [Chloroflexia bacterium]